MLERHPVDRQVSSVGLKVPDRVDVGADVLGGDDAANRVAAKWGVGRQTQAPDLLVREVVPNRNSDVPWVHRHVGGELPREIEYVNPAPQELDRRRLLVIAGADRL